MIKFREIEDAFYYVNSGRPFENMAIVRLGSGRVFFESCMLGEREGTDEDWEADDAVSIPHKNDLDMGSELVDTFVVKEYPEGANAVRQIFSRRGAYGRYKEYLDSKGLLKKWYDFEEESLSKALRDWCKENKIVVTD